MMKSLDLSMPTHLTEALRTNMSGGKTVGEMLAEATAHVPFMSMAELRARVESGANELVVLDVREKDAYEAGHIPGARLLPRGQLELRVDKELPDPTARIVTCCEFGRISTLAASTLRTMGFQRAVALDGGMKAWLEAGYPVARRRAALRALAIRASRSRQPCAGNSRPRTKALSESTAKTSTNIAISSVDACACWKIERWK